MSWFNQKVYTEAEVREGTLQKLPSNFQIGQDVWLHMFEESDNVATIVDAVIAGVSISARHVIQYDLFFKIGPGYYVRVNGFRGFVTEPGQYIDSDGGLVSTEEFQKAVESAKIKKPCHLTIVKNNP